MAKDPGPLLAQGNEPVEWKHGNWRVWPGGCPSLFCTKYSRTTAKLSCKAARAGWMQNMTDTR